jgi:tetratricopeptide (TPR) repeat protein
MDARILEDASATMNQTLAAKQSCRRVTVWSTIMKSRKTRLATAAVIVFAAALSLTIHNITTRPAWGIGQTVRALGDIRSLVISGSYDYGSTQIPFKLWIRPLEGSDGLFEKRFECEKQLFVIRGVEAWAYWPDENVVKIYDDVTTSYGMMRDLRFWYKLAQLNPWITGKLLEVLKWFADDWQEVYGQDERTGRDCVFVTCSYGPESHFWFVCDLESKLIVEGKYWNWSCNYPEDVPVCHATSFAYNEEIDDGVFEFQMPDGAKVIKKAEIRKEEAEADALSDRAEHLFHNEKKHAEALELYQQVYDKFPDLNTGVPASNALMMIGICYYELGQPDKAIEAFERGISEYGHLKGHESTYFYLGYAYMDAGEKEKALEAFENCLAIGQGERDPDKFPLRHARECIAKIKSEQDR